MAKQSNRLARAFVGVVVVALGAVLLIMGSSHFHDLSAFGFALPPEVPGLALLVAGVVVLMQSTRARNQEPEAGDADDSGDDTIT